MKNIQSKTHEHLASMGEAWCNSHQNEKKFSHYLKPYKEIFNLNSFQLGVLSAIHFY